MSITMAPRPLKTQEEALRNGFSMQLTNHLRRLSSILYKKYTVVRHEDIAFNPAYNHTCIPSCYVCVSVCLCRFLGVPANEQKELVVQRLHMLLVSLSRSLSCCQLTVTLSVLVPLSVTKVEKRFDTTAMQDVCFCFVICHGFASNEGRQSEHLLTDDRSVWG